VEAVLLAEHCFCGESSRRAPPPLARPCWAAPRSWSATTHESPEPTLTISGSLLAAMAVCDAEGLLLSRAAQIVTIGTGRRARGARGVAVCTALLRAFARRRMTRG
jgi:hypothetical protein